MNCVVAEISENVHDFKIIKCIKIVRIEHKPNVVIARIERNPNLNIATIEYKDKHRQKPCKN